MEHVEGKDLSWIEQFQANEMIALCRLPLDHERSQCCRVAWRAMVAGVESPIDELDEDGPTFTGPHLGEEC